VQHVTHQSTSLHCKSSGKKYLVLKLNVRSSDFTDTIMLHQFPVLFKTHNRKQPHLSEHCNKFLGHQSLLKGLKFSIAFMKHGFQFKWACLKITGWGKY
jgi:hypothetical protein